MPHDLDHPQDSESQPQPELHSCGHLFGCGEERGTGVLREDIKDAAFTRRAADRLLHMDEMNRQQIDGYLCARGRARRQLLRASSFMGALAGNLGRSYFHDSTVADRVKGGGGFFDILCYGIHVRAFARADDAGTRRFADEGWYGSALSLDLSDQKSRDQTGHKSFTLPRLKRRHTMGPRVWSGKSGVPIPSVGFVSTLPFPAKIISVCSRRGKYKKPPGASMQRTFNPKETIW